MKKWIFISFLVGIFILPQMHFVSAQSGDAAVAAREAELRRELSVIEEEIKEQEVVLENKQRETTSLERDVDILDAEIQKAQLNIRAKNLEINRLEDGIGDKEEVIGSLEEKIFRTKESLAQLVVKTNELDEFSLVEMLLANESLSTFFVELDSFETLENAIHESLKSIRGDKDLTKEQQELLEVQQRRELDDKKEIEAEKRQVERSEVQKQKLLNVSLSEEAEYERVLEGRQAEAAKIRTALFSLRDTAAIPFGEALAYAKEAEKATGVRPAFVLAILTQESNLGENVGTCNRPGDPPSKSWKEIMKPSRDQAPYLRITKALGLNPDTLPLSCPWQGGWGGAMGPSQFIPSTWDIYDERVASALGKAVANPWEPRDAITASSFFLKDIGANGRTYSDEREAALRYYAGGNWHLAKNAFYGNGVMAKAQNIQENMIDPLEQFGG
jgi:peptidoglycan hydrolase CwlO-like protein